MKILELFAGSRSIGKVADELGYKTFSTDLYEYEKIDYQVNILEFNTDKIPFIPDIIWASPPCTTFSVASMGHHWTGGIGKYKPATKECKLGLKILEKTIKLIAYYQKLNPNLIWYIENPMGVMRKVIDELFEKYGVIRKREHVWYCQYLFNIAKPTDIWTNNINFIGKRCYNKKKDKEGNVINHCHHESAPRGSRTGTQGKDNAYERGKIPRQLCLEVLTNL